jgi:pyridoxal phosphate enzyme (YggS family)
MSELAEHLESVRERIQAACEAAGRPVEEVELVAVSKKKPVEAIREALEAGQDLFGENRVQEVMVKQPELPGSVRWHLIGHLQSNKVKQAVQCRFDLIHSVDSEKLMRALDRQAAEDGWMQPILIQVNVAGEAAKFGVAPDDLLPLLETANDCRHLDVQGLMTLPPLTRDPAEAAPFFAGLRDLRDRAADATGFDLVHLSMGMSRDLEPAIREGATLVRVGTDIFGARK